LLGGDVALGVGLLEPGDLLGDRVDLRARLVDALLELAGLVLERDDAVDVAAGVLVARVGFDLVGIFDDEFDVEHGRDCRERGVLWQYTWGVESFRLRSPGREGRRKPRRSASPPREARRRALSPASFGVTV